MGFRQPFTLHTDPKNPGLIGVGEYCHDASTDRAQPLAGRHVRVEPRQQGRATRAGRSASATSRRRTRCGAGTTPTRRTTGEQYDCSLDADPVRHQLRAGRARRPTRPTFQGLDMIPKPVTGDDLEEVPERRQRRLQSTADFGDLTDRRHAAARRPDLPLQRRRRPAPAASRAYYDGSWLINNRGANDGWWKEVRLRSDNNQMLRVHDWLPYNHAGSATTPAEQPRDRHAVR